jgi:PDZ domain-containing secreted protein
MFCKDLEIKFIENIESNNEFRRHLMQDLKDAKQKKKLDNADEILSVDESKVDEEPKFVNLIDHPYYETNRFKDTIEISNDQQNFMLHLEVAQTSTPVI